ncbi:MAG: triosephosphate isomerase [Gammaproteobacteria bacterium]|nr:triosephosphate isomerase [Gammaproteobacteria bacterium]
MQLNTPLCGIKNHSHLISSKILILNWKHHWIDEWQEIEELLKIYPTLWLAPPAPLLGWFALKFPNQTIAQSVTAHELGAYTGAMGPSYFRKLGMQYSLIGHHDLRACLTHAEITKQYLACWDANIVPILGLGEYDRALRIECLEEQLAHIPYQDFEHLHCFYEPRWAIGAPEPCDLTYLHQSIEIIADMIGPHRKGLTIYGGSVTLQNAEEFLQLPAINGLILGRLSLDIKRVTALCERLVSLNLMQKNHELVSSVDE